MVGFEYKFFFGSFGSIKIGRSVRFIVDSIGFWFKGPNRAEKFTS